MATRTDNLKLSKAETSDAIKSTLIANNQNFDKLDGVITRLKNNQLRGTASGTEIEISDAGEVESVLQLSGNSEQDSRTGKNKLAQESFKTAQTINGITFTPNEDGSIKISGTATARTVLYTTYKLLDDLVIGKTYISSIGETVSGVKIIVEEDTGGSWQANVSYDINVPWTFNGLTAGERLRAAINIASGTTVDVTIYPQIEEGSTATPYEQYGLKPSPKFESPIMSVKGKSDNLFDISAKKDNTSFIWGSGLEVASEGTVISDYIAIDEYKEISSNYKFIIAFYDVNKVYLGNGEDLTTIAHSAVYNCKIPNNADIAYFRVAYRPKSVITANPEDMTTVKDIMVNKGTVALPYQPYGYVPAEARVEGKNLFDQDLVVTEGITTKLETGFRMVKDGNNRMGTKYYIDLKAGQYKMIGKVTTNVENAGDASLQINYADGSVTYLALGNLLSGMINWGVPKDIVRIQPYFQATVAGGKYWEVTDFMILRKEETDTTYAKGGIDIVKLPLGDIELRSTPDGTRDTFTRVDGTWNKKSNVGNTIVNGQNGQSASLVSSYVTENHNAFTIAGITPVWNKPACKGYSNKFKVITSSSDINGKDEPNLYFGNVSKAEIWVKVSKETAPTVADFKTWLINNPIEIQYPLAEPAYEPVADQALITALDELEELILHKGYNHITATAVNGVKAQLDLSYYKDINIVLDNINASILSLGGGINV